MKEENQEIRQGQAGFDESLLMRYAQGEATAEEKQLVEQWAAASAENEETLLQVARICLAIRANERMSARNAVAAYHQVMEKMEKTEGSHFWRNVGMIAAVFVGIVLIAGLLAYMYESSFKPSDSNMMAVRTQSGMRTTFALPDSSVAYLNAGSALRYPQFFTVRHKERVFSLQGEGYFKVKHDDSKPFIVSAADGKLKVRATGTEFNVQAYPDENRVRVTLLEGSVSVTTVDKNNHRDYYSLLEPVRLTYNLNDGSVTKENVNAQAEAAWRDGRLVFKETPMAEVFEKMQHMYNVKIIVRDPVIYTYRFTGTFENRQISQVLDYLRISSMVDYHIQYSKEDDSDGIHYTNIILYSKNKELASRYGMRRYSPMPRNK